MQTCSIGIRTSLAMIVVGCILPLSAVAGFLMFDYYQREQSRLTVEAISRARAIVSAVDRDFAIIQASLTVLATSTQLATGDFAKFHEEGLNALQTMSGDSIILVDNRGQMLMSTRQPFGTALPKSNSPELLDRIRETGRPGVSDLFIGALVGKSLFSVGVPVRFNGDPGSLNATVQPTQIGKVLTEQRLPDSWRGAILDRTGTIVARTHEMDKYVGVKAVPELLRRLQKRSEDSLRTTTLDGVLVLSVYSRSPTTGWTVVLGMPAAELTQGLRRSFAWLIFAATAALTLGVLLAWIVGGRIARSIGALAGPARQLASGHPVAIPILHFREAIELRDALVDAGSILDEARHNSHHDALTGLANRARFDDVVEHQLALCKRYKREMAVLFIDLDGFKAVNDTHGHGFGDALLRQVSQRIRKALRESDVPARFGGDEFAVCLCDTGASGARQAADKLLALLSTTFEIGGIAADISASIGVATFPTSAKDRDTLLKRADRAMYDAKSRGKNQVCSSH